MKKPPRKGAKELLGLVGFGSARWWRRRLRYGIGVISMFGNSVANGSVKAAMNIPALST